MLRIAKQGRRVRVEAQNAVSAERFRRSENKDFIGEPLSEQSRREARAALAKYASHAPRGQESQRGIKIDVPRRVAAHMRDLYMRLAQAGGTRFACSFTSKEQCRDFCRRHGKLR